MWWLLNRTRIGLTIRAGVDDRDMLAASGVRIQLVIVFAFGVGRYANEEAAPHGGDTPRKTEALRLVSGRSTGRVWMSNPSPPTRWSKPVPVADFEAAAAALAGSRPARDWERDATGSSLFPHSSAA